MKKTLEPKYLNYRTFNKTQERMLTERLEHYYAHLLYKQGVYFDLYKNTPKTSLLLADRRIRAKLKSCEILLISLNSKLFENVKSTSIRKTLTIEGTLHGIIENSG